MIVKTRAMVAVFAVALLLCASPALGGMNETDDSPQSVPVVLDVMLLRPIGLVTLAAGATMFAVVSPFVAVTRPQNIRKPLDVLVMAPAKYVWSDPLGQH